MPIASLRVAAATTGSGWEGFFQHYFLSLFSAQGAGLGNDRNT